MQKHILYKVYGQLQLASPDLVQDLLQDLKNLVQNLIVNDLGELIIEDITESFIFNFAGITFPQTEFLQLITNKYQNLVGRIDFYNLENWTLTRYTLTGASYSQKVLPLNNVLDWATTSLSKHDFQE